MSEHLVGWADSVGCWLLAWAVVVVVVVALGAVFRPRRASVRYGGWLLATFSGVGLLLMVLTVSPVVTWGDHCQPVGLAALDATRRFGGGFLLWCRGGRGPTLRLGAGWSCQ